MVLATSQPETISPTTSDESTSEPTASFNDILPGTSLLKKNHQPDTSMISYKLQFSKSKQCSCIKVDIPGNTFNSMIQRFGFIISVQCGNS